MTVDPSRGIRTAQLGLLVNACLAVIKILAGVIGNSYALIADGVESTADLLSSTIVWGGLRIATRDANPDYPFGYGKAETLAGGFEVGGGQSDRALATIFLAASM